MREVITIRCRIGGRKPLYQHLVTGSDAWLWVDAGVADTPSRYLFPYLGEHDLVPPARQLALITHADVDHFGGVAALREQFTALTVLAHRLDAPWIRSFDAILDERYRAHRAHRIDPDGERRRQLRDRAGTPAAVDVELEGGETVDLGNGGRWTVVHAPGHSPGHVLVWDADGKVAIVGDAVLGWGVAGGDGRTLPPAYDDLAAYVATIDMLGGLAVEQLLTSHFAPTDADGAVSLLDDSKAAVEAIGSSLAGVLSASAAGMTLAELCVAVGDDVGRWPSAGALGLSDPLSTHLAELVAAGQVIETVTPPVPRYVWTSGVPASESRSRMRSVQ